MSWRKHFWENISIICWVNEQQKKTHSATQKGSRGKSTRTKNTETDYANADHNLLRGDPSLTSIFDTYNPSSALIR